MTGILSSRSVAFGCVAEPTPRFYDQVMRLVQSIRWFGGSLADADVFICFVGEIETARRRELEALGAQVRVVQLFTPLNRFSNKIRFLELPELAHYETAVLLDCDVALVQDPAPYIVQPALQLMIADLPTVSSERLAWLCTHFDLVAPAPIYRTTCSQEPTIWYCNTGVMILPTAWIARILPVWREYILQLCAEPALLDPPYNHCNQAAMALTYIANPVPFAELPMAMNFPLHHTGRRPAEALLREDPVILHYHDRVDADGLLLPVPYPLAQARIQQLNERLRASARLRPALAEAREPLAQLGYPLASDRTAEASPRVVVCITGMHRSGTSLTGQILHRCGPYLGPYSRLATPAADNLDGYWEHPDFRQLNDDILAHFGGGWDLAPSFPADWADLPELEPLRQRARTLISQFDNQRFWGWKDPRSALTIPFWRRLLPDLKVVICVRNPLEVAQSLSRRGMSSLIFGLRLWQTYYERVLAAVPLADRIVTHYDSYFTDAVAETKRILNWLNIPSSPEIIQRACRVASHDLRHHRDTNAGLLDIEVPAAVLQLYSQLCDEVIALDDTALNSIAPELASDPDNARLAELAEQRTGALAQPKAHETALATLRSPLVTYQTELAILRPVLEAREAEVAFLQPALAAREAEIANFARELASMRELVAAREAEIANFACELASMHELVAAREAEIANFARELASMRELVAAREAEIASFARELLPIPIDR